MADTGSYVYLATRGITEEDLAGLTGVADRPTRLVAADGLVAVVSTVDLAEFGEEALRRNLEDLAWLEATARAHDRVIQQLGGRTTVAPWRLATILLDDARVAELLTQWRPDLEAALDRVEGCREWSVKGFSAPPEADGQSASTGRPESGTAYLMRRRTETDRRAEAVAAAVAEAEQVHRELSGATRASRRLPPQDRRLSGHRGEMQLNGAYLVPNDHGEKFEELTRRLAERHPTLRLEVNGPWPPYSFATLEPEGPR
jgi:hypothetical protein